MEKCICDSTGCLPLAPHFRISHIWWGRRHRSWGGRRAHVPKGNEARRLCRDPLGCWVSQTSQHPPGKKPPPPRPTPSLTPFGSLLAQSLTPGSGVQPEGRRLESSTLAAVTSAWFLVCYLHCSLGEKTSLPTELLQFLLFIQDYTYNPIIKHRSCPESRVIAYRCAQTKTSAHPKWPPAGYSISSGWMTQRPNWLLELSKWNSHHGKERVSRYWAWRPPSPQMGRLRRA